MNPDKLGVGLRICFTAVYTACAGLIFYCKIVNGFGPPARFYLHKAAMALLVVTILLFIFSLVLLAFDRGRSVLGLVTAAVGFALFPPFFAIIVD